MSVAAHRFDNEKRRRPDHHARQAMLTPPYVLEPVRALMGGFGLDPCTEPDNPTGADRWYSLPDDGCALPWNAHNVWCNPPYGEARDRWVDRCISTGARGTPVALLIPAHTETRTFQRAFAAADTVLFFQARLRFGVLRENGRQEAASHGSALFGFGIDLSPLHALGTIVTPHKPAILALQSPPAKVEGQPSANCSLGCGDTGYRDHEGFRMDPCPCTPSVDAAPTD